VVPVKRAQDEAKPGTGTILIGKPKPASESDEADAMVIEIEGFGSKFTEELNVADKVRPPKTAFALKVKHIINDTKLIADASGIPDDFPYTKSETKESEHAVTFDVLKHTPLNVVFAKVLEKLATGGTCRR